MKILLNYADGKFAQSQVKNSQSGLLAGFNVIYQMSRNEIDPAFQLKNAGTLSQKRGAGYWLWKAYFINQILPRMTELDVLFYSDSGSIFARRVDPLFEAALNDPQGVLCFELAGRHLERLWTKRDVFLHMGLDATEYKDTPQRMASFMVFRGTSFAKDLAREFLDLAQIPHLLTDTPNSDQWEEPGFKEHRHDQSLWSLLTKLKKVTTLPDPTQWGQFHKESAPTDQYLLHTRDPN